MFDFSQLSERILYGLQKTGKKQADLCKFTGCKSSTVSDWCNGKVKKLNKQTANVEEFTTQNWEKDIVTFLSNLPNHQFFLR